MQAESRACGTYCGSQEPQASGREWMLGTPKGNDWNGFLKQTCRNMSDKFCLALRHMLRTSAAERLTASLPTHRLKAESRQFFIDVQHSHIENNRDHNQYPVVHILDTTTSSFASTIQP